MVSLLSLTLSYPSFALAPTYSTLLSYFSTGRSRYSDTRGRVCYARLKFSSDVLVTVYLDRLGMFPLMLKTVATILDRRLLRWRR